MEIDAFGRISFGLIEHGPARGGMSLPDPAPVTMAVLPASDTAIKKQSPAVILYISTKSSSEELHLMDYILTDAALV